MGTTSTSGWALLWFLLGFTIRVTAGVGGGILSILGGAAVLVMSGLLFQSARAKEES